MRLAAEEEFASLNHGNQHLNAVPGLLNPVPDDEWSATLASGGVDPTYGAVAQPNAYLNQKTGLVDIKKSWADAAAEGVELAVLEVEHEVGHKLRVPLNDHPTDAAGLAQHAATVNYDSRAGTYILRLRHGPPEVVAAAQAAIQAYKASLTAPAPPQTAHSLVAADLLYSARHFGFPLAAAILAALASAWQTGQLVSLHTAETVAIATAAAYVAGKFHAVLGQ